MSDGYSIVVCEDAASRLGGHHQPVTRESVLRRSLPRALGGSLRGASVAPARVGRGPRLRY